MQSKITEKQNHNTSYTPKHVNQQAFKDSLNKVPEDFQNLNPKTHLAYLCHFTYCYGRIARALLYNYGTLNLQDLTLNLSSLEELRSSIKQMMTKIFNLVLQRLLYFENDPEVFKQFQMDFSLLQRLTKICQTLLHYLGVSKLNYPKNELENQSQFMKKQNYTEKSQKQKLVDDIEKFEDLIELFINKLEFNFPESIVEEAQKQQIDKLEPFFGYTGLKPNLVTTYQQAEINSNTHSLEKNDIRGVFASGESSTLYVAWHGSCQEFDWHTNCEMNLVHPNENLLPEFPRTWKMAEGFSNIIQLTWNTKQSTQQETNIPTFSETLQQKLQGKKTVLHTGHSLGAALGQLATVYSKVVLKDVDVRGWIFSQPRTVDQYTSEQINNLFEIDQKKGDNKLIRQNVFGDPVPIYFASYEEYFNRIKRFSFVQQIIIQERYINTIQEILEDQKFIDSMNTFDGIVEDSKQLLFEKFIINPLNGSKYNGNLSKFILDFSSEDTGMFNKGFWKLVVKLKKEIILSLIPDKLKNQLDISDDDEDDVSAKEVRQIVHSIAKMVLLDSDSKDSIDDIFFESEYQYEYQKYLLDNQDHQHSKYASLFSKTSKEMLFSKTLLQEFLKQKLQGKYIGQKLSLLGEIFEGLMYLSADYGDTGMLLLDSLDFHSNTQRVDELRQKENYFSDNQISIKNLNIEEGKALSEEQYTNYSDPYHYGQAEKDNKVDGTIFSPNLVIQSDMKKMYGYANYYMSLSPEQRASEYYLQGLLRKFKPDLEQADGNTQSENIQNIHIMIKRIKAKLGYSSILINRINLKESIIPGELFQKIISLLSTFIDTVKIDQEYNSAQLKTLVSYSYFLSSLFKALKVLCNFESNPLEQSLQKNYQDFINEVKNSSCDNLEELTNIHKKFIFDSIDYVRNTKYEAK